VRTYPCALVVHAPWTETEIALGARKALAFENAETTQYAPYVFGPTEVCKTALEARAAFLEDLMAEHGGAGMFVPQNTCRHPSNDVAGDVAQRREQ
jgi:hypothetical protein